MNGTVARNLRALRDMRETTQGAIASVAGVTAGSASAWFNGAKVPRTKYLERIASYYKVSVDDLLSERDGLYAKMHGLTVAPSGATAAAARPASTVPVRVLGAAHADQPDEAWEFDDETALYEDIAARHPDCFALEVNGDCMDRLFTRSDYIFVDPHGEPRDSSIVVASVDGQAVVRRVKRGNGSMLLVAESSEPDAHPDIIVRDGEADVRIFGTVFFWQCREEVR